jgi:hypothetical protein
VRIKGRAHVIGGIRASLLPTVADSSNAFFVVSLEEVDGAEGIFVPIRAPKGTRAASVIGHGLDLFFSALGERGDSFLPGRFCRMGLGGPYGRGKAARWRRDVLQDGDEWLRRPHDDGRRMYAKEGFGARVAQ